MPAFPAMLGRWSRVAALGILALAVLGLAGCSKEAKKARAIQRGEEYYKAQQFEKAEIEFLSALRLDQTNRLVIERLASIYWEGGNVQRAFLLTSRALGFDTNNYELRLRAARCLQANRDYRDARREAAFVLSRQPTNEEAMMLLGASSINNAEMDDALARLQAVRAQAGGLPGFHVAWGSVQLRQHNPEGAKKSFQQALQINPKFSAAHAGLANAFLNAGDVKQAESSFKAASELAPLRSERRLIYAEYKMQAGDMAESRRLVNEVLKQAPDYFPAMILLSQIDVMEKKYEDAAAILSRMLSRDPAHFDAALANSHLKLLRGQVGKGVAELELMATKYPRTPQVHYELGLAHVMNKDIAKAITSLHKATQLNTNYLDAALLLAELSLSRGDSALTVASMNSLVRRYPQVLQAHMLLARGYLAQRNIDNAYAVARRAAELFPRSGMAQFQLGVILREQRKPAEARKAFEAALVLSPDELQAIEHLVAMDVEQKQFAAAAERLQKAEAKHPKAPGLKVQLALLQLQQRNTNQAVATLQKTLAAFPDFAPAHAQLATIQKDLGQTAAAIAQLRALLNRDPKNVSALTLLGMYLQETRDFAAARDTYEKALVLQPQAGLVLNNLIYLYAEDLNQLDKAFELANKNKTFLLNDPSAADTVAWVLFKKGEYEQAAAVLKDCAAKMPNEAEVQYHLGMALYMMANEAPARAALTRALELKKDFRGRKEAETCLAFLNTDSSQAGAIPALEARLNSQPGDPVALNRLAAAYEKSGATDKAVAAYEKILKTNPKAVTVVARLAQLYSVQPGGEAKAMEKAKAARALAPTDPAIAYTLGTIAYRSGDHKWALSLLQESARQLDKNPDVLHDLALALYSNARITEAETAMKSALQIAPAFSRAESAKRFLAMSTLYTDPARAKQSSAQIQEVLKTDQSYIPALMAAAVLQEQAPNIPAARQAYERIVAISPAFTPAARQLAFICAQSGSEDKQAYEFGMKARETYPQDADLAKLLGTIAYRRADYSRAAQFLREASRTRANDPEVFYHLGMAQSQLKSKKEATESLNKALSLNLKSPLADEAKRVLATLK